MKELSLHILDIAQNSITANGYNIVIELIYSIDNDLISITIRDDGSGMSPEFLERVIDPFTTSRTTRNVGMGIPLFRLAAIMTGGDFDIKSQLGKGTDITAEFKKSHIDCPPLGDIDGTILTLIQGNPDRDFILKYETDKGSFIVETLVFKNELGDISLSEPEVLAWIGELLKESREAIY